MQLMCACSCARLLLFAAECVPEIIERMELGKRRPRTVDVLACYCLQQNERMDPMQGVQRLLAHSCRSQQASAPAALPHRSVSTQTH